MSASGQKLPRLPATGAAAKGQEADMRSDLHLISARANPPELLDAPKPKQREVRSGSKADVTLLNFDVRFTPESGHCGQLLACPLVPKADMHLPLCRDARHTFVTMKCEHRAQGRGKLSQPCPKDSRHTNR
jgi:hypothetical protein